MSDTSWRAPRAAMRPATPEALEAAGPALPGAGLGARLHVRCPDLVTGRQPRYAVLAHVRLVVTGLWLKVVPRPPVFVAGPHRRPPVRFAPRNWPLAALTITRTSS